IPYSDEMTHLIDTDPFVASIIAAVPGLDSESFQNEYSIWKRENWKLEPNESISYISINNSISNLDSYSQFFNYSFIINENTPDVYPGNVRTGTDPSMALETDNESWVIDSERTTSDLYELGVYTRFLHNASELDLENNTIQRASIRINFTSSLTEDLDFQIYNYSANTYQSILPNLRSVVNDTWTFDFVNINELGFNGLFKPDIKENHSILFKIYGSNDSPFNLSINDLDVILSERDVNAVNVDGATVKHSSPYGQTQLERRSNTFTLSTYDMASITARSYLSNFSVKPGDLSTYILNFTNIGSEVAKNVSINILIPGIINNTGEFNLTNNYLTYNLKEFAPGEHRSINFSFYVPNQGSLDGVRINYDNPKKIANQNSTSLSTLSNEVYYSAPVDYKDRLPYVRTVDLEYTPSNNHPEIGEEFSLTVGVENTGPEEREIPDLQLNMDDQYGDLKRIDHESLNLTHIGYGETKELSITLHKQEWKGYYYPPINFLQGSESRTIQISKSKPLILGTIEFDIEKSVDVSQVEMGDNITVSLKVTNTGDICIKNFTLDDVISYSQLQFSLVKGKLINKISRLKAGETKEFTYKIKAKTQSDIFLKAASIEYYNLLKNTDNSNQIHVKIIIPRVIQSMFILLPAAGALALLGLYYRQQNKYKEEKMELRRNELLLFTLDSEESVLKVEHTLKEELEKMAEGYEKS
ncbi:MAG: CARDB domain-containing protein, partial [Promethearchaeia archaeon]